MDELGFEVIRKVKIWLNLVAFARAPNGTKISHQERIFTRINMDELGFEVIRKVKIWLNLGAVKQ